MVFVDIFQLMATKLQYTDFLFRLSDLGCELEIPPLRDSAREILRLMPAGESRFRYSYHLCLSNPKSNTNLVTSVAMHKSSVEEGQCIF